MPVRGMQGPSLTLLCLGLVFSACTGPMAPGRKMEVDYPPFYSRASDPSGESCGYNACFHMVKHDRSPDETYTHVIPFYFDSAKGEDESLTLVPPFFYGWRAPFERDAFFLLWGMKQRGFRQDIYPLYPLMRYTRYEEQPGRWEAFLFPLLDLVRDGDRHHLKALDLSILFGLFQLLDLSWGIPTADGEGEGAAFSLINVLNMVRVAGGQNHGGYRDFQFLTLFSNEKISLFQRHWEREAGRDGRTVLFPFYWHLKSEEGEAVHLWPLYGWRRTAEGSTQRSILYPFLGFETDPGRERWTLDLPWPLVRFMRGLNGDRETRLLPLLLESREGNRRFLMAAPFYASYDDGEGYRRRFYTPFFSHYTDRPAGGWGVDILFPFFSHQKYPDRWHSRFLPLYYLTVEERKRVMEVTPLFWSVRNEEGYAFDLLFPLYAHFGIGEQDHTYSVLPVFKLMADRPVEERTGRFQVDLLWPFILYRSQGERTATRLFPLFSHSGDTDRVQWGFVADIFQYEVFRSRKKLTLFWFIPISWGGEGDGES